MYICCVYVQVCIYTHIKTLEIFCVGDHSVSVMDAVTADVRERIGEKKYLILQKTSYFPGPSFATSYKDATILRDPVPRTASTYNLRAGGQ